MKVSLPGLFANVVSYVPASDRAYFEFCLGEVLLHLRETIRGQHTLEEFAEHYCLTDAIAEKPKSEPVQGEMTDNMNVLNNMAALCHEANRKWWSHPNTGEPLSRNKGELLMLIVSEVAECMEGERKDAMDNHISHRKMAEVELADILIRVFDYAGAFGYDLDGAFREKMRYNAERIDHQTEARLSAGGKRW